VVGAAVLLLCCACSGRHGVGAAGSRTPRITVGSGTPLFKALVTAADLRAVPGLPSDVHVTSLKDLNVFEDPDPRAPCGAHVPRLNLAGAAGVGIRSSTVQGAELVVPYGPPLAGSYLDALVADAHEGCPPYRTITNTGATQTVTLRKVFALPELADGALAVNLSIRQGNAGTSATLLALRKAGTLALTTLFAPEPLSESTIRAFAVHAAAKLAD
jgi:hypothetical protein